MNYPLGPAALQSRRALLTTSVIAVALFRLNLQFGSFPLFGAVVRDACVVATWVELTLVFFACEFVLRAGGDVFKHHFEVSDELAKRGELPEIKTSDERAARVLAQLDKANESRRRRLGAWMFMVGVFFDYLTPIGVGLYALAQVQSYPCP
jgi:hypothetical protein